MLQNKSVLIVESNADLALIYLHAFECAGSSTRVVATLADAIAAVEADPPEAIVADAELPAAQCAALVMAMRCLYGAGTIPIVVLSSNAEEPWYEGSDTWSPDVVALLSSVDHAIARHDEAVEAARYATTRLVPIPNQRMFEHMSRYLAPAV